MSDPTPKERRIGLNRKILVGLVNDVTVAQRVLEVYEHACMTCRMLNDALIRKHGGGTVCVYDYGMDVIDNRLYCPTCKRCVWEPS